MQGDYRADDLHKAALRYVMRRFRFCRADAEEVANEGLERLLSRYGHRHRDDARRLLFTICQNLVYDRFRREERLRRPKLPRPAQPVHRFGEFIYALGRTEAQELMNWHLDRSIDETAAARGVKPASTRRMRRRIVEKWRQYLKDGNLSQRDLELFREYLSRKPSLGDIE